jgi:hypothetical protein
MILPEVRMEESLAVDHPGLAESATAEAGTAEKVVQDQGNRRTFIRRAGRGKVLLRMLPEHLRVESASKLDRNLISMKIGLSSGRMEILPVEDVSEVGIGVIRSEAITPGRIAELELVGIPSRSGPKVVAVCVRSIPRPDGTFVIALEFDRRLRGVELSNVRE